MKILFISPGNKIDYECDCVFHGLSCLDDVTVYTLNDYWYMYTGNKPEDIKKQYGMGFTITNRILPEKRNIHSLSQAQELIQSHFYDIVIYGSILRCEWLLEDVFRSYSKEQIIFIDGEDHNLSAFFYRHWKYYIRSQKQFIQRRTKALSVASKGFYFKRELLEKDYKYFFPISFAVPSENIVAEIPAKSIEMATIIPGDKSTYIYDNEEDYYKGYQMARFGTTCKKGGWECMRHYEILANGCIPYFPHLGNAPSTTMVNFPREIILETNRLYESRACSDSVYRYYCNILLSYTREYLTTRKLAEYILSFCGK